MLTERNYNRAPRALVVGTSTTKPLTNDGKETSRLGERLFSPFVESFPGNQKKNIFRLVFPFGLNRNPFLNDSLSSLFSRPEFILKELTS